METDLRKQGEWNRRLHDGDRDAGKRYYFGLDVYKAFYREAFDKFGAAGTRKFHLNNDLDITRAP